MVYDAILMVIPDKVPLLKTSIEYMIKNLGADRIFLVANKSCELLINNELACYDNVLFLDEEAIFDGLNIEKIRDILKDLCGDYGRAGWFYQQFLKMAYAFKSDNEYYLVFDSDTVPLNNIKYFSEDGKPCFITKVEYHKPYFDTLDVLTEGKVRRVDKNISYIAENMIINKKIMVEIIDMIMNNQNLKGDLFFEKILYAISKDVVKYTGFSEFETYGNYIMTNYPSTYNRMKLRTQRRGTFLFGPLPNSEQLEWASKDYDIISFENYGHSWLKNITNSPKIREKYTASQMFRKFIWISNLVDVLRGREVIKYDG